MKKIFFSYILAVLLIYYLFTYCLTLTELKLILEVNFKNFISSFLFCLTLYFISGFFFSNVMYETTGKKLKIIDMVAFPLSRNLWGYVLPFQGAFIYSLLFCKYKYNVQITKITSINIFMVLVNIFFLGMILLYIFFGNITENIYLFIIGLLCLIAPLLFILASFFFDKVLPSSRFLFLEKIRKISKVIINDISSLVTNFSFFISIFIINLFHFLVNLFWFVSVSKALNLNLSVISLLTLVMVLKTLVIVKITPGNIGVEQLISGCAISLFSLNPADGIIISTFTKIFSLSLALIFGTIFTIKDFVFIKQIFKFKKK
jgi:hypothetical protein